MSRRVQKVFTAERRLKERTGGVVEDWSDSFFDPTLESGMGAGEPMQASLPAATSAPETSGITQAILDEIRALRGEVSQLRQAVVFRPVMSPPRLHQMMHRWMNCQSRFQVTQVTPIARARQSLIVTIWN